MGNETQEWMLEVDGDGLEPFDESLLKSLGDEEMDLPGGEWPLGGDETEQNTAVLDFQ